MNGSVAFFKKEMMELMRTRRALVLGMVTVILGVLSPLIARLTPWLMKQMAESLQEQGFIAVDKPVTALDSWMQFGKNYPILLLAVVILFCGGYVTEYGKGTLIPLFTKGLSRITVVSVKFLTQVMVWSVCFFGVFGITWGYTAYYWDNSVAQSLGQVALYYWLTGVFFLSAVAFFSSFCSSTIQVILGAGGLYFLMTLLGMVESLKGWLPTRLMECISLVSGGTEEYAKAAVVAAVCAVLMFVGALIISRRRV